MVSATHIVSLCAILAAMMFVCLSACGPIKTKRRLINVFDKRDSSQLCLQSHGDERDSLWFLCRDNETCIRGEYRCNNVPDCPDKSDEEGCGKPSVRLLSAGLSQKKSLFGPVGSSVQLTCEAKGLPAANITLYEECLQRRCNAQWTEIGFSLPTSTDGSLQSELTITVTPNANVSYRCLATNAFGEGSDIIRFFVTGPRATTTISTSTIQKQDCSNKFICASGEPRCLPKQYECNGPKDCEDGSDEANCTGDCKMNFMCVRGGYCIDISARCDKYPHCEDGSDEANCAEDGEGSGEGAMISDDDDGPEDS